jgi:hypothetical protein
MLRKKNGEKTRVMNIAKKIKIELFLIVVFLCQACTRQESPPVEEISQCIFFQSAVMDAPLGLYHQIDDLMATDTRSAICDEVMSDNSNRAFEVLFSVERDSVHILEVRSYVILADGTASERSKNLSFEKAVGRLTLNDLEKFGEVEISGRLALRFQLERFCPSYSDLW